MQKTGESVQVLPESGGAGQLELDRKFRDIVEEYGVTPESVRWLCKMKAVEVLKKVCRYFEANVVSGKYQIIKDFTSDNPALLIRIILNDKED
jgi:hypothetical protein